MKRAAILLYFAGILTVLLSCNKKESFNDLRSTIELAGHWQLQLDTAHVGNKERWFEHTLTDDVTLPGSLDENKKGFPNKDTTEMHLNRLYQYTGAAWYRKEINIPADWKDKHIELIMERTKVTTVWLDRFCMGTDNTIFSQQVYDLTGYATPGRHILTVMVDNTEKLVPVAGSHAYSEDMQTNWNGILGRFCLEASHQARIVDVRVYPDIYSHVIGVCAKVVNDGVALENITVELAAELWNTTETHTTASRSYAITISKDDPVVKLNYDIGKDARLWSEFDPALYKLTVTLRSNGKPLDKQQVDFGLRKFSTRNTNFIINDLVTFLRGKHDGGIFPLTGYPWFDTAQWVRAFKIAKTYGINHYRFHSWCPPAAAFAAADKEGVYLQPELPAWWGFKADDPGHVTYLLKEGRKIMDAYGNHASFVMFALGNELGQDRNVLKGMVSDLSSYDDRPLYAQGSNNRLWDPSYAENDNYWTTFRTSKEKQDMSSDVRGSVSFLDSEIGDGGIINTRYPSTDFTYIKAIEQAPIPIIGHEIGQYQVYPRYEEMKKYTGVLKPWNFEIFRRRLKQKGMLDQADDFFKASGMLAALCYRADIEMALRTPGFGGFQLLDLQDYPGQGTALVGMLDVFMDSKGLITPGQFRQFCNNVVILLVMDKYCWQNNEKWIAEVKVANYSAKKLTNKTLTWQLKEGNALVGTGKLIAAEIPQGSVTSLGKIELTLSAFEKPSRADVHLAMESGNYQTQYPIWIYPANEAGHEEDLKGVTITSKLTPDLLSKLNNSASVLLFPEGLTDSTSVGGQFISEFWNYGMFTSLAKQFGKRVSVGTMGILTDPDHPIFKEFPTDYYTNWQWWPVIKASRPVILDKVNQKYRPLVQVIDNINRNHKLGLIFEFSIGKGRLLVCTANLRDIHKPETQQLYKSILHYMQSDAFTPTENISVNELTQLF